ncbi:ROK family protein [Thermoanaerobacter sp. YS13]|uniref:ROK family protein n=1 Tax=Thermoanaerobacter sp. YS13 TaxID=1511746 RepID=UPI000A9F30EC|nr:ROK family protein [Thermoanaerobacter sp. YS13]
MGYLIKSNKYEKDFNGYVIGIDVGGTKTAVILGDTKVNVIDRIEYSTKEFDKQPMEMINKMIQTIKDVLQNHKITLEEVRSIGISSGGPLDLEKGIILSPPNLPGWDEIPIVDILSNEFNVPVYLENDANAGAVAEWNFGSGVGCKNLIFLTFGTGMGAGLILDGKLYRGTNGMAGEVGHIRLAKDGPVGYGKKGSFEGFCSGGGITRLAQIEISKRLSNGESVEFCPSFDMLSKITAEDVAVAAQKGDKVALEIIKISAEYLGLALSILIDILNPEKIILGTIFTKNESLFRKIVEEVIKREALEISAGVCKIQPSKLGNKIGDYAALSVALRIGME